MGSTRPSSVVPATATIRAVSGVTARDMERGSAGPEGSVGTHCSLMPKRRAALEKLEWRARDSTMVRLPVFARQPARQQVRLGAARQVAAGGAGGRVQER